MKVSLKLHLTWNTARLPAEPADGSINQRAVLINLISNSLFVSRKQLTIAPSVICKAALKSCFNLTRFITDYKASEGQCEGRAQSNSSPDGSIKHATQASHYNSLYANLMLLL